MESDVDLDADTVVSVVVWVDDILDSVVGCDVDTVVANFVDCVGVPVSVDVPFVVDVEEVSSVVGDGTSDEVMFVEVAAVSVTEGVAVVCVTVVVTALVDVGDVDSDVVGVVSVDVDVVGSELVVCADVDTVVCCVESEGVAVVGSELVVCAVVDTFVCCVETVGAVVELVV